MLRHQLLIHFFWLVLQSLFEKLVINSICLVTKLNMKNSDFTILVVDDNEENLKVIGTFLLEQEYKLAVATDGPGALQIVLGSKIDLILLDVMMPGGMDGFETCIRFKEDPKTSEIPVIFLTAKAETTDIVKGFRIGGVDYVTKPFRQEELLARVRTHLKLGYLQSQLNNRVNYLEHSRAEIMQWLNGLAKSVSSSSD